MSCRSIVNAEGEVIGIACTRGAIRCECGSASSKLCDFPLKGAKAGKTCDRRICGRCAVVMGPNKDYCPAHARSKPEEKPMVRERFAVED